MKLSSTNKTHVYFLLVLFDVLRRYVATKKSFCVQYFILRLIQIIKFCKSLSYSPFRLTNVIKLSSSHKRFCRVVFKRLPLIPKSIFTGEYQHLYTCCFILIFISNLTCCMCTIKIYLSNQFIAICHMPLYYHVAIFLLKSAKTLKKLKAYTLWTWTS